MKSTFFVIDELKRISHLVAMVVAVLLLASSVRADVITFDDIDTSIGIQGDVGVADVPTNYHAPGLTWTGGWAVIDNQAYNATYHNTKPFPSSPNAVGNSGNQTVSLASTTGLFNMQGAYFSGGSEYDDECWATALSLTVTGYNNGTVVGTRTFNLAPGQLQWQDIYINGVNRLDFSLPSSQQWFLMDNLTITTSDCRLPGNPLCQLSPMTRTAYNVAGYAGSRFTFDFGDPTLLTGTVSWPGGIEHGQVDGLYAFYPATIAASLDGAGKQVTLGRVGIDGGLGGLQWIWDAACSTTCPGGAYTGQGLPAWDNVSHATPLSNESFQIIPIPTVWSYNRFPTSGYVLLPTDRPQTPDASCIDATIISDIPWDPGCTGPNNSCGRTEASCSNVMQGAGLYEGHHHAGNRAFRDRDLRRGHPARNILCTVSI
ncbi:MAG: hypothetical protein ABSC55_14930 [Syntrophorhabdales bacterium]|jgi:hypothetical protein